MNLDQFFEKFELLSETPNAVEKMRELILDLAVTGRLVPLGAHEEVRRPSEYRLKDLCLLITDGEHATPQRTSEGIPLVTAKNVRDGHLDLTNTDWVSPTTAEKCWRRCRPSHKDILMVCVGATTGRLCVAENPLDMVLVRSVALLRPDHKLIYPYFLSLFLRSPSGQDQIWSNVKQSAQPCLYLGRMGDFIIRVPPLPEQKRIVAKVDELMALCDRLEAQQKERETQKAALVQASLTRFTDAPTPTNLEFLFHKSYAVEPANLKNAILSLAFCGKLLPQDQDDKPDAAFMSRISKASVETSDSPFQLPVNWRWMQLGNLCQLINGDRSSNYPNKSEYVKEGVPWINTGHIEPDGTTRVWLSSCAAEFVRRNSDEKVEMGQSLCHRKGVESKAMEDAPWRESCSKWNRNTRESWRRSRSCWIS